SAIHDLRAIVLRASPTAEIAVCELVDRNPIFRDSAVSSVIAEGVSFPSSPAESSSMDVAWRSSAAPQARASASKNVPPDAWNFLPSFWLVIGVIASEAMGVLTLLMCSLLECGAVVGNLELQGGFLAVALQRDGGFLDGDDAMAGREHRADEVAGAIDGDQVGGSTRDERCDALARIVADGRCGGRRRSGGIAHAQRLEAPHVAAHHFFGSGQLGGVAFRGFGR